MSVINKFQKLTCHSQAWRGGEKVPTLVHRMVCMAHVFSMNQQQIGDQWLTVLQFDGMMEDGTFYIICDQKPMHILDVEKDDAWAAMSDLDGEPVYVNMNHVSSIIPPPRKFELSEEPSEEEREAHMEAHNTPDNCRAIILSSGGNAMLRVSDSVDSLSRRFGRTLAIIN